MQQTKRIHELEAELVAMQQHRHPRTSTTAADSDAGRGDDSIMTESNDPTHVVGASQLVEPSAEDAAHAASQQQLMSQLDTFTAAIAAKEVHTRLPALRGVASFV